MLNKTMQNESVSRESSFLR